MGYPTRQSTRQIFHVEPNLYHAWLCLLDGQISFVIWILKSKMSIHLKVVQSGAHGKFRRDCRRDFTRDDCSSVQQWKIVVTSFHLTLLLLCLVTWLPIFHGVEVNKCERIEAGSQLQHVSSLLVHACAPFFRVLLHLFKLSDLLTFTQWSRGRSQPLSLLVVCLNFQTFRPYTNKHSSQLLLT